MFSWNPKPTKPSLPLYKDKPTSPPNKLRMLIKSLIGGALIYTIYTLYPSSTPQNRWKAAQNEVRDVFLESWHHYEKYGWGKDEFHPVSKTGRNMGPRPLGWIIVDSLDTLALMDMPDELSRARQWVKDDLDYRFDYNVNVFETTIRMLGGLLSAFHFTNDDLYLDRAVDLANALEGGFKSKTGVPYSSVNLLSGEGIKNHVDNGASSTAEVATLQLEFKYLAKLTGEAMYWELAEKVMAVLDENNSPVDGLVPIYVQPDTGKYQGTLIRMGSRGDSYYEYLLKQYLQTNGQEPVYNDMYRESVAGVKKHMLGKSVPNGLTFVGELERGVGGGLSSKMDHLVCFYGGLLALGATNGVPVAEARKSPQWTKENEDDFKLGEELTHTCYRMYADVETGLSPEIVVFNTNPGSTKDFTIKPLDRHNLQRPETVESLFYLYRLTGDKKYREWGYEIFKSFVKHTAVKTDGETAYTSLDDVTKIPPKIRDNTESFWFAETLKYLYLLFDDDNKVPLDQYVFNTEAHPFPRFDLTDNLKTGWRRGKGGRISVDKMEKGKDEGKIPVAQPVDKPVDQEMKEEVEKNPELVEDGKRKVKEKLEKLLKDKIKNEND